MRRRRRPDMDGNQVFASHPSKDLMAIHDPNEFGCTPCHNGNGLATASVAKAHGDYRHWLWPLFAAENAQAGCVQCHFDDRVLQHAEVLNRGRDLYQLRGCVGCHRHEEYDRELDTLTAVQKEIQNLSRRRADAGSCSRTPTSRRPSRRSVTHWTPLAAARTS